MPISPPEPESESGDEANIESGGVTLFLDRNSDGLIVRESLRRAGANFERHDDHFDSETPDVTWIPAVAERGWLILTRDRKIITNSLEIQVVRRARAGMFALIGGQLPAPTMAQILTVNLPQISRIGAARPRPFIAKIYRDGQIAFVRQAEADGETEEPD